MMQRTLRFGCCISSKPSSLFLLLGKGDHGKSKQEVKINVDFIDGDSKKAVITAEDEPKKKTAQTTKGAEPAAKKEESVTKPPGKLAPVKKGPGPTQAKAPAAKKAAGKSSDEDKKSKTSSSEDETKKEVKPLKGATGSKKETAQKGKPAAAAAKEAPVAAAPTATKAAAKEAPSKSGKAAPSNGNGVPKIKPNLMTPATATKAGAAKTGGAKGPLKPVAAAETVEKEAEEKSKAATSGGGWQSSILEGEEWRVTISSKHELLTSSDPDNKTVTIRPKTPPKVEKAAAKAAKAAVGKKEKKITFEKKLTDARSGEFRTLLSS